MSMEITIRNSDREAVFMTQGNMQDTFLNSLRKNNTFVTVFLLNGFQLKGLIKSYDNYTVLLESDGKQQLIYKHAISTFTPSKPVVLKDEQ